MIIKLKFSVYDTYKINKVKELRIDSTLWATPARLVNYSILNQKN